MSEPTKLLSEAAQTALRIAATYLRVVRNPTACGNASNKRVAKSLSDLLGHLEKLNATGVWLPTDGPWFLKDEDSDTPIRGPYRFAETAGAVRAEMERAARWEGHNLQIVSQAALAATEEATTDGT